MSAYPVMRDPETQLRLLSFQSSPSSPTLECRLEVYDMTDCPPYHAITYAYGDPACSRPLVLNGEEISMNPNGYDALQQVRAHAPGAHFWLDSLCINQTNLEEKAVQVHKIAKIFAGSFEVWAYLGPHGDDSEFLLQRLASLPQEDAAQARISTFHEQQEELLRRTINWLVLLEEDFDRFAAALKAFGRRSFFSRMWIYQELYLAARIKMVCGTHRTNMQALKDVSQVCSELLATYNPQREYDYKAAQVKLLNWLLQDDGSLMWTFNKDLVTLQRMATLIHRGYETSRQKVFWGSLGIVEVQRVIRNLQCQDPRDKIFAVLSLFGDSCRIMPDYTLTSFDLALLVLKEYAACTAARDIVELAVHLCHNLRPQLNERLEHSNLSAQCRPSVTVDAAIQRKKKKHGDAMPSASPLASAQVTIENNGQMNAAFEWEEVPVPAQITSNRILVIDKRSVALATCELKVGDWIALLSYQSPIQHHFVGLVLRLQQGSVYDIVGEVALCSEWKPSTTWSVLTDGPGLMDRTHFWARFEVLFDLEEVLLLALRLHESLGALSREEGFSETDTHRLLSTESLTWKRSFANRLEPYHKAD